MRSVSEMKKVNRPVFNEAIVRAAEKRFEDRVAEAMRRGARHVTYYAYTVYFNWSGLNGCPWESELEEFIRRVKLAGYTVASRVGDRLDIRWA